ncbi:hypothetical protein ACWEQN_42580 [Streptomyces sp. NPDC004129]
MNWKKQAARIGVSGAAILALGMTAFPAHAGGNNISSWTTSRCNTVNWFCLYYSPNAQGAGWGYPHADANVHDLGNYRFPSNDGAGSGEVIRNNAASAEDASDCNVGIWEYPNFNNYKYTSGNYDVLSPWRGGNLGQLRNDEASIAVWDSTNCPGTGEG